MGNAETRQNSGRICSQQGSPAISFDDENVPPNYNETTINRGTIDRPKPQLKFHSVCGTNIIILRDGRVAKRRESFCKGLAFSNRPIGINEIVCIRLCEVGTNWSGVMRFGVTNVDPASFRDIELPKFACPDLTSKGGYWAKSLAERFSVQGLILHFFVNESGEMHYGVNGVHKGLFLSGININSPLWTIVDIYGNSVAVEFLDPTEVSLERTPLRTSSETPLHTSCTITPTSPNNNNRLTTTNTEAAMMTSSRSTNNLRNIENSVSQSPVSQTPSISNNNTRLRFHPVKGNNVVIQNNGTTAVRKHGEYYLGYVFTERPIKIGEKLVILISMTEDAFSGSLAFGLTSCDPVQVPASRLPADSDELLERPEYWVCIKDVGAMPQVGTTLNFKVDTTGRVLFSKNDAPFRVIMHVDISIPLWAFFDLYGSTRKIQILDLDQPLTPSEYIAMRGHRASSEGAASIHGGGDHTNETSLSNNQLSTPLQPRLSRPSSATWNMESLRVALPPETTLSITPPTQTQIETNNASIASNNQETIPSSSAPSQSFTSSWLNELRDISTSTQSRINSTLRRLNLQQAELLNEANASNNLNASVAINNASPYSSQNINDFIFDYRQQRQRMQQNHSSSSSRSPVRRPPINSNNGGGNISQRSVASTNLFESSNNNPIINNSGASITVPLLPPSLFSSININNNSSNEQNLNNRAAEFEAALSSSLSSDHSPNRRNYLINQNNNNRQNSGDGGGGGGLIFASSNNDNSEENAAIQLEDGDRNNECTICMTNRVNAVIYRCGHMAMCFPCAKEAHRRSGDCPICRTPIIDVIRCYPV